MALAAAYRRGEVTPVKALADCFERIDAVNPRLNALVALRRDAAFADAGRSAQRFAAGAPLGPLDGIPLAVKDNIPSADLPTTWGSPAGRDHRPAHDELALARARAAGAIVVGKTNVPEFTLEGYTGNPLFGTTRNPWNPALTPGGSSGGSVAAVAAGMVPLALGTDGGGSTRRPASHTGLVGFKPSIGAIAREHALPPLLLDFEVIGPIARSVADVRLLFDALRGPHPADRRSRAAASARPLPDTLRVLYVPTLDDAPVDAEITASCRAAAQRLQALGHRVDEGPLPLDLGFMTHGWPVIGQIGLAWLFERHPAWRDGASARYLAMAEAGAALAAPALWQILETVEQLRREAAVLFGRFDLIVTPAAAALPWPADEAFPPVIAGQPVGPRGHAIFTGWVNAAGLPAVALPAAASSAGLPIGVQLIADFGCDQALLELAECFEAAAPGGWAWPPL
ncbi:MAG: amidase [Burkholderiaceae bacterium]|nr:amidase [Burkholderiaceae bacterium]